MDPIEMYYAVKFPEFAIVGNFEVFYNWAYQLDLDKPVSIKEVVDDIHEEGDTFHFNTDHPDISVGMYQS